MIGRRIVYKRSASIQTEVIFTQSWIFQDGKFDHFLFFVFLNTLDSISNRVSLGKRVHPKPHQVLHWCQNKQKVRLFGDWNWCGRLEQYGQHCIRYAQTEILRRKWRKS